MRGSGVRVTQAAPVFLASYSTASLSIVSTSEVGVSQSDSQAGVLASLITRPLGPLRSLHDFAEQNQRSVFSVYAWRAPESSSIPTATTVPQQPELPRLRIAALEESGREFVQRAAATFFAGDTVKVSGAVFDHHS